MKAFPHFSIFTSRVIHYRVFLRQPSEPDRLSKQCSRTCLLFTLVNKYLKQSSSAARFVLLSKKEAHSWVLFIDDPNITFNCITIKDATIVQFKKILRNSWIRWGPDYTLHQHLWKKSLEAAANENLSSFRARTFPNQQHYYMKR